MVQKIIDLTVKKEHLPDDLSLALFVDRTPLAVAQFIVDANLHSRSVLTVFLHRGGQEKSEEKEEKKQEKRDPQSGKEKEGEGDKVCDYQMVLMSDGRLKGYGMYDDDYDRVERRLRNIFHKSEINMLNLGRERDVLEISHIDLWKPLVEKTSWILGPSVVEFETALGKLPGLSNLFAIGTSSGTMSLELCFRLMKELNPSAKTVLVPSFTFMASASAALLCGLNVEFIDIEDIENGRYLMSLDDLKRVYNNLKDDVLCVVGVSLFGQVLDYSKVRKIVGKDVFIVEDAAQSFMSGNSCSQKAVDFCTLSFYPSKLLGGCGDSGAILCSQDSHRKQLVWLRNHGQDGSYSYKMVGQNGRMSPLQAVVLKKKLEFLPLLLKWRKMVYRKLMSELKDVKNITLPSFLDGEVPAQFTILANDRNGLLNMMSGMGIHCRVFYPQGCHEALGWKKRKLSSTDCASKFCLSIPCHPFQTLSETMKIVNLIKTFH